MKEIETLNDRNLFKQSHGLNFTKFKLSALALDILHLFLTQILKEDTEFKRFKISFADLQKKLGKQINRSTLEETCDELLTCKIKFLNNEVNEGFTWCSRSFYHTKEHWVVFEIHEALKDHLLNLKTFALVDFKVSTKLKSVYSKRIYSMLKQYVSKGYFEIGVNRLSNILGTNEKYERYSNFKFRVLKIALEQINEHSDLNFTITEVKSGRKVDKLIFNVNKKEEETIKPTKVNKNIGELALEAWENKVKIEEENANVVDVEIILSQNTHLVRAS